MLQPEWHDCWPFNIQTLCAPVCLQVEREVAAEERLLEEELQSEVQGIQAALKKALSVFKPAAAAR